MTNIRAIVENRVFQRTIITVILVNAVVLGLLTLKSIPQGFRDLLILVDRICLAIFIVEIALRLIAYRFRFFLQGWNVFDFLVIAVALVPAAGPLAVLRALRVLRLLRLATAVPSMRRVINGMFVALPGGASVAGVLLLLYYVGAIIGNSLFGADVPQYFGDIGTTFFTLFKMMTLEGWPDIASEVLVLHPRAWIFFVVFIVFTTFTTLNLLFGIIVDAMEKAKEQESREELAAQGIEVREKSNEMRLAVIEEDLRHVRQMLEEARAATPASGAGAG